MEEARDVNIIETSLREMEEEIGQWAGAVLHPLAIHGCGCTHVCVYVT